MSNKIDVKICIFDKNTSKYIVLYGNGDAILDRICTNCEAYENANGLYDLDATFITDEEGLYRYITDEAILKVKMDYGNEIFRIAKISKQQNRISVYARQITIDETLHMWIEDIRPTNTSGLAALTDLKNNSIGKKDIDAFSDIDTSATAYYQRMNMYQAIHDSDQSFLSRWGGEVQRRGYSLTINKSIGTDRGVEIKSRKNLTGFEASIDIDNVVTRIRPIGFDGIYAGRYVDSPLINNYSSIKTREIKYDDVKVKGENDEDGYGTLEEAQKELIRRAELEFSQNNIDQLRADYRINFIYLEQTEEYKDYIKAERVYIGDTVSVFEEKHNINIQVRVIAKRYDVLNQKVIDIELSNNDITNKSITTSNVIAEIQSIINSSNNTNFKDVIQSMINSGVDDSYVLYRQNELLILDNKDINLAKKVVRLNKNGLGFSKTGYSGPYDYGFTIDGIINASLISTGILSAILIQNKDGSLQIDLSGANGIITKANGKNAIELSGTKLIFYDWDGGADTVGQIYSSRLNSDENKSGIVFTHNKGSYSAITYQDTNNDYKSYVRFDKDNIAGTSNAPINIYENIDLRGNSLILENNINYLYSSISRNFVNKVKNTFVVLDLDTDSTRLNLDKDSLIAYDTNTAYSYCKFSKDESYFANGNSKYFSCSPNGFSFWKGTDDIFYTTTADTIQSDRGIHINGNFTVNGNKNCVQSTENYGDVLYYSVEDCESYLTDRSMELFTVEGTNEGTYERVILLDNVFKESVNLDLNYTVEVIKQGWGDYRIKEQTKDYFIVESDRKDFTFKYIVTGKRKGYEDERNKSFYKSTKNIQSNKINKIVNLEDNQVKKVDN